MGGVSSLIWGKNEEIWPEGVDPDLINPETNLTPRDVKGIQESFQIIVPNVRQFAIDLFISLFSKHPEHQALFPQFDGMDAAQLRSSKTLAAHSSIAAHAVAAIVETLGDYECLEEMLHKIGDNHRKHQVKLQAFKDFKEVLIQLLREKLGSKFSPKLELAWDRALTSVNDIIRPRLIVS